MTSTWLLHDIYDLTYVCYTAERLCVIWTVDSLQEPFVCMTECWWQNFKPGVVFTKSLALVFSHKHYWIYQLQYLVLMYSREVYPTVQKQTNRIPHTYCRHCSTETSVCSENSVLSRILEVIYILVFLQKLNAQYFGQTTFVCKISATMAGIPDLNLGSSTV